MTGYQMAVQLHQLCSYCRHKYILWKYASCLVICFCLLLEPLFIVYPFCSFFCQWQRENYTLAPIQRRHPCKISAIGQLYNCLFARELTVKNKDKINKYHTTMKHHKYVPVSCYTQYKWWPYLYRQLNMTAENAIISIFTQHPLTRVD